MSRCVAYMLLVVMGLFSTACLNLSSLQTARALEVGEYRLLMGGGVAGGPLIEEGDRNPAASDAVMWDGMFFPYLEMGLRVGVMEGLEIGGKWAFLAGPGVDAKYQFLDRSSFAAAVGLSANYRLIDTRIMEHYPSEMRFDVQVPVYLSYDFSKDASFYWVSRYLLSFGSAYQSSSSREDRYGAELLHLVGGTAGVRLGDAWGVFGEVSVMTALNKDRAISLQGNGSFYVDF